MLAIGVAQAAAPYIVDALAYGTHSAFESVGTKVSAVFVSLESPRLKVDEILEKHAASACVIEAQSVSSPLQERFTMNGDQAHAMFADAIVKMLILSMTDIEEESAAAALDCQTQFSGLRPADIVTLLNRLLASDKFILDDLLRGCLEALLGRKPYVEGSYIPLDEKSIRPLLPPDYWDDEDEKTVSHDYRHREGQVRKAVQPRGLRPGLHDRRL